MRDRIVTGGTREQEEPPVERLAEPVSMNAMQASNEILLVTYEFPYGTAETFLESEVLVLARAFSRVWILPSRAAWSRSRFAGPHAVERALPENCTTVLVKSSVTAFILFSLFNAGRLLREAQFERTSPSGRWSQLKTALRESAKAAAFASTARYWPTSNGNVRLAYSYWKSEAATALALLEQRGQIPAFVTRCHRGDLYHDADQHVNRPFDRFVLERCTSVMPVSQHGCAYLISRGAKASKVKLARLGVSMPPDVCRASKDGVLRILSCSNAIPVKRLTLLANALRQLDVAFEWIHFGDGPDLAKVEEIVASFPAHGSASFRGRVPNVQVLNHYRQAPVDVFVNVSSSEGVPVSVMEALSAGVPCIVTDVGGTSEIVDDTCGCVVDNAIADHQLAMYIRSVATEREAWLQRREGARSKSLTMCDAERNYLDFCRHLKACIENVSATT